MEISLFGKATKIFRAVLIPENPEQTLPPWKGFLIEQRNGWHGHPLVRLLGKVCPITVCNNELSIQIARRLRTFWGLSSWIYTKDSIEKDDFGKEREGGLGLREKW